MKENTAASQNEFWEVNHAAGVLANYACTVSARHIHDGALRLQFNREVAYYMRGIVRDVEEGRKTAEEGLKAIRVEQASLLNQTKTIALQSLGVAAGGFQIVGGVAMCVGTVGWACPFGVLAVAHGANNVYENGRNLWERKSDTKGPLREAYQYIGGSEYMGNMAYGAADIGLSIFGIIRPALKPDAWKLFKYMAADKEMAFRQTSAGALTIDAGADVATSSTMLDEWKRRKNE